MTKKEEDYVKKLKSERKIISQFLIKEKNVKRSMSDKPYLQITLQDKTGRIIGRMFNRKAQAECEKITINEVYNIVGKIQEYPKNTGKYNIIISRINKARSFNEEDFIIALENQEIQQKYLEQTINEIKNPEYKTILKHIFGDEKIYNKFIKAPAAKKHHHNYIGGLLVHTNEVAAICKTIADIYEDIDKDLLITGALLHDIGKIYTYDYESAEIEMSHEGIMLEHIFMGSSLVKEKMNLLNISSETKVNILHLILSHHGKVELGWGSAISPKKPEAIALHQADDMSAKVSKSL